jgi:multicomponent Na+:H+ antiporter subunit G
VSAVELVAGAVILVGAGFFVAGTAGVLRFPDVYSRLHALTKADNLGLGLVVVGLALVAGDWAARVQLLIIWVLVIAAASTVCHVLGRSALDRGVEPWRRE